MLLAVIAAGSLLAACDRPSSPGTPDRPATSSASPPGTSPSSPPVAKSSDNAGEKGGSQPPIQGQVDPKQAPQRKDFEKSTGG